MEQVEKDQLRGRLIQHMTSSAEKGFATDPGPFSIKAGQLTSLLDEIRQLKNQQGKDGYDRGHAKGVESGYAAWEKSQFEVKALVQALDKLLNAIDDQGKRPSGKASLELRRKQAIEALIHQRKNG